MDSQKNKLDTWIQILRKMSTLSWFPEIDKGRLKFFLRQWKKPPSDGVSPFSTKQWKNLEGLRYVPGAKPHNSGGDALSVAKVFPSFVLLMVHFI